MIIGKEALIELEVLAKKQEQIYPDSCDYGLWVNSIKFKNYVRSICKRLKEDFIGTVERWTGGCSWGCFIPFEHDGAEWVGVKVTVSLNKTRKGKEYFTIDINRHKQTETGFKD